jgi:hypothetical protein
MQKLDQQHPRTDAELAEIKQREENMVLEALNGALQRIYVLEERVSELEKK